MSKDKGGHCKIGQTCKVLKLGIVKSWVELGIITDRYSASFQMNDIPPWLTGIS